MASQFKNRLVGVTILVALVVIFLPSIIDGEKITYEDEFVSTPIKPQLKMHRQEQTTLNTNRPEETAAQNNNGQWKIEQIAQPNTAEKNTPPKSEPIIKTVIPIIARVDAAKVAWTIQLGAFRNAKNINALLKKLNKAGFQVHTTPRQVINGQLTRIFVGPNVSKEILKQQMPELKKLTKLQGKLVPFNALNP